MKEIVVCNSSCLIALDRIKRLDILQNSFQKIIIPHAVKKEVNLRINWISTKLIRNKAMVQILNIQIGEGESEAIALALELGNVFVLLDDKKARQIAKQLGLKIIGTIGLILRAKRKGLIREVKPVLNKLIMAGFRIKHTLYQEALHLANED